MHLGICTAPHPLQYGTPPPPSPMPHLLQEMVGRWCHWSVSIVLKIEVYDRIKSSSCSHSLVVVDKTSIDVYRHLEKSMKLHFWKKWHGTASKVLGIEGRLFFVFWSTPVREIATFAKVHFSVSFSNGEDRCKKSSELQLQANWPRSKHFDIFTTDRKIGNE